MRRYAIGAKQNQFIAIHIGAIVVTFRRNSAVMAFPDDFGRFVADWHG
jgi:hypothetical protein